MGFSSPPSSPPGGPELPRPENAKEWAILVGLIISVITLWKLLWTPTQMLGRWIAEKAVLGVLKRCTDEVRRVLREVVLKADVDMVKDAHDTAHAAKDTGEALLEAQKAQGAAMIAIEKELKRMELMPETLDRLAGSMEIIGGDLRYIRGRLDEREGVPWDGKTDRRKNDTGRDEGDRRA